MYRKILVPLENSDYDEAIVAHVTRLAKVCGASILLVHVADGWVARNFDQLNLAESEEMKADWKYLEDTAARLRTEADVPITTRLALGNPPNQILKVADSEQVDLIAMASLGHRLVGDIIHGSTIDAVRHGAKVPMVVVPPKQA